MQQCHCSTPTQRMRLASAMIAHEGQYRSNKKAEESQI